MALNQVNERRAIEHSSLPDEHRPKHRRNSLSRFREKRDDGIILGAHHQPSNGLGGLLNAAIAIAIERQNLLLALKSALDRQDSLEIVRLAGRLCGADDEKSGGANSRIN